MDPIPKSKWCTCVPTVQRDGKVYPPMTNTRAGDLLPGWMRRNFLGESERSSSSSSSSSSQEGKKQREVDQDEGVGYAGIEGKKKAVEEEVVVENAGIEGKKSAGAGGEGEEGKGRGGA